MQESLVTRCTLWSGRATHKESYNHIQRNVSELQAFENVAEPPSLVTVLTAVYPCRIGY